MVPRLVVERSGQGSSVMDHKHDCPHCGKIWKCIYEGCIVFRSAMCHDCVSEELREFIKTIREAH